MKYYINTIIVSNFTYLSLSPPKNLSRSISRISSVLVPTVFVNNEAGANPASIFSIYLKYVKRPFYRHPHR